MKICFVANRLHTNMHDTIDALISEGHDVSFISVQKSKENQRHDTVDPFVIEHKKVLRTLYTFLRKLLSIFGYRLRDKLFELPDYDTLEKRLKDVEPDVVIIKEVAMPLCLTAFYFTNKLDIETILYTQHPLESKDKLHVRFLKAVGIVPECNFTPARNNRKNLHNEKTNSYYVPLVVRKSFDLKDKQYFNHDRINILFIGKFTEKRKKHILLLRTIKQLKGGFDINLTMIGTGSKSNTIYQNVKDFIEKNGMNDMVTIKTNLPFKQMPEEYKAHDLYVLPSINEPFSISPLEAMSYGLPAIITTSNGARGCIQNGVNGYAVKPDSKKALHKAIEQMMDKSKIQTMGKNAFEYIKEYHSKKYFLKRLNKIDFFRDIK
jgi:glycosyltransferase involved in cell wall biosynthesis